MSDVIEELRELLYNFWILKSDNPTMYYKIKKNQNRIREFVNKNLGSNLIIHDRFIKLEKIPSVLNKVVGIPNFSSVFDYVILCILLMYLEDKAKGEKFILSNLVMYVESTATLLELSYLPDWNKVSNRRSLINVMTFLSDIGVIKTLDATKNSFTESIDAEVLYEVCGISNYVMRMFNFPIYELYNASDFIDSEYSAQEDTKGDVRRFRVFRNLLYTPSVPFSKINSSDIDYFKKNRMYIKSEVGKLDMEVEITQNLAIVYDSSSQLVKENFPNSKKITDIVLMVASIVLDKIKCDNLKKDLYEDIMVSNEYFLGIVSDVKENKKPYLGKTFGDYPLSKFYIDVITYMERYNMITVSGDNIILHPSLIRMVGKTKEVNANSEQLDIFGGSNELL